MENARFSPLIGHADCMGKKRLILLAVLLLVGAGGIAWLALRPTELREPVYQGKRLSVWLAERRASTNPASASVLGAENALRASGKNALPFLTTMASSKELPIKSGINHLLRPVFHITNSSAEERRTLAMDGFHFLRKDARSAIPALIKPLNDGESAEAVAFILADIGPNGLGALTNALSNSDARVRASVVIGLGRFAKPFYGDPVSPTELDSLAKIIVPVLINSLRDPDANVRSFAAMSLGWFAREPATVVPALTSLLSDQFARGEAAYALGQFGPKAQSAVPALLEGLKKERQGVAEIRNALKAIDPAAAAKAGIKGV
jgi:HEAT repeat protein